MQNNNHLIIMAGGVGSRFWPMSTPECPKQFIDVLGVGKSLLQLTVERFEGLIPTENIWVVTSKNYKKTVMEQIPQMPEEQILLEPCMRNTAPCIAYVTYKIRKKHGDANLVFSPADHIVIDTAEFGRVVGECMEFAAHKDAIVTLGMKPTRPETGYGYIKAMAGTEDIRKVEAFKEKPNRETAKGYVEDGSYFWNAGIFAWRVSTVVKELEEQTPELAAKFEAMSEYLYTEQEQAVIDREFPTCESISIDYAVMERSERTYVCPASFGWSDLGTWGSLYTLLDKDSCHNAVVGEAVTMVDCEDCIVHVSQERKVVVQGLKDYIIAERDNTLLICEKGEEQRIKQWQ